jgi:RNA polymerase sigma-70 factor (ECF subfamily)
MPPPSAERDDFATTLWSVVLQAQGDDTSSRVALAELCRQYWYPIYAYLRRKTGSAEQAEDLTQGFFAHLLDGNGLANVSPDRGRFRAFLLACCNNFLANERARESAQKRGGRQVVPLDNAEARYNLEPADHLSPDRLYEREWAITLLYRTFHDLESEYSKAGQTALFERLRPTLTASADAPRYAEVAAQFGLTEAAVKKAAQRLRERYGAALRHRIGMIVEDPSQIDDEIRGLFAALSGA